MIVFFHMIKTAGMTFSYILRNNYGQNYALVEPVCGTTNNFGQVIFTDRDLLYYLNLN